MNDDDRVEMQAIAKGSVPSELYEDLLGRYERALVYAAQLQERGRQQTLLEERARSLEVENDRLRRAVGVEESYVRLLESALRTLGFDLKDEP